MNGSSMFLASGFSVLVLSDSQSGRQAISTFRPAGFVKVGPELFRFLHSACLAVRPPLF